MKSKEMEKQVVVDQANALGAKGGKPANLDQTISLRLRHVHQRLMIQDACGNLPQQQYGTLCCIVDAPTGARPI